MLQNDNFLKIFSQLTRHPLIKLSHLSNFLQMLSHHRMVDTEFFRNLSCGCKRISFNDALSWSLSTFKGSTRLLISKALIFVKPLEPPMHCPFISSSWGKCPVDVASCLCCFTTHFELKQENRSNLFLSNIISIV